MDVKIICAGRAELFFDRRFQLVAFDKLEARHQPFLSNARTARVRDRSCAGISSTLS